MGKLLALELYNFKSYRGHHVMQFGDSYFTSIIGPNGSGKSNSMDAISFVLGIKTSHLRSNTLKDLVYRGRVMQKSKINADGTVIEEGADEAGGDADAGASDAEEDDEEEEEVEQPRSQRDDPQTGWVMAVYEDDAGEEQRWKRSITTTGTSEYRINNRPVPYKQYNEALEAENILIKARNFLVFQGDVETIASQSPKDLTKLIEQISGSLEHKPEYDRLKAERALAEDNQTNKSDARRTINGEIKEYQRQKNELDKYEQTRDERDQATVTHVLWKLFHFQRTIEDSTAEIQKHQAELKEFKRNVRKFQDKLEAAKAEQAKVGREISKFERDMKHKGKDAEEQEQKLVPIDEKLAIHSNNVQRYKARVDEITRERNQQQAVAEKMQKELAMVQKAQKRWEDQWNAEQQKAGRALSQQDLQELERLKKEVYKRTGSDQNKIENITRQLKTDEETVNSLKSKLENTEALIANLREDIAAFQQRRDDTQRVVKATGKAMDEKKQAINRLVSDHDRSEQRRRELDEKLQQVLVAYDEAKGLQRENRKEAEQRIMVSDLRRIYPGVKGQLGLLVRPKQKKYETAVSTVLGRHYDAIIVDTEKTAQDCIQFLKDGQKYQATFIPLDTIIHKQPNANLRGMHQGMRLAIDTIDFDTNLERAMSFACGNAIVTDTIAIAKELVYRRGVDAKAVALDGTIIHKGGNMTGGNGPGSTNRRFDDAEVEKLTKLIEKFRGDIDELPKGHKKQAEQEQLRSELYGLETKQKYAQDELATLDRNIHSKSKELQHLESQLAELRPKYEEQAEGVETLRETLDEHQATVSSIEDEVFAAFCQRTGYENIREYEKQNGALQEEARVKDSEFKRQTSRLENQLEYENQRLQSTEGRLKATEAAAKRDQDQLVQLQAQKDQIAAELAQISEDMEEIQAQIDELKKDFEERGEKVQEARRDLQKRSKGQEKTLKEISILDAEVQKAASGRYSVLRACKVENINVPLEDSSRKIAALPLEDESLQDEDAMDVDEEEGATTSRYKDYGIHIDFSELEEDLQQDGSEECGAQLSEKISTLSAALDKMAPNMRSADRLEATSTRLNAVQKDFDDAKTAFSKVAKEFEKVRKARMDLFNKAFTHISEQIGPVYRELTKTPSFPLGGSASLDVEDDDEPYLTGVKYHAMPPLKRFRDMEHLSGGEKTMAALALLFAVHTYAPSPFFVLDEVDAALDHANTTQLAQYVREHAGPGMQFVVISLKTGLFQNSETLVGIMRDQGVNSSRALTLDVSAALYVSFSGVVC